MQDAGTAPPLILVVDDELITTKMVSWILWEEGLGEAEQIHDSRQVMPFLERAKVDLVLLDLNMPHIGGKELLEQISSGYPDVPVIILTNEDRVETAVECMKVGAFDFITKPLSRNRLIPAVRHALTIRDLKQEVKALSVKREPANLAHPEIFSGILTANAEMFDLFRDIERIAITPWAVLITGESGTGKELVSQALHRLSGRKGSLIAVNLSGLDDTIFTDTLFGHLSGSFTGAEGGRKGLVEQASGGTLFLDEIGDLEHGPQVKLLRLLQDGTYYPIGSDVAMKSNARIVAATNADLRAKQIEGKFRRDLYYRLNEHHLKIPPLRDRPEDISILVEHFVKSAARTLERAAPSVPAEVLDLLSQHRFPGNVRELQLLVNDAVSRVTGDELDLAYFEAWFHEQVPQSARRHRFPRAPADSEAPVVAEPESPGAAGQEPAGQVQIPATANAGVAHLARGPGDLWLGQVLPTLDGAEDFLIRTALERAGGNQSQAAKLLGVSQSKLSRWLRDKEQEPPNEGIE